MILLAFDTATTGCSAAIWRDGAIVTRRGARMERGQSEALVPMIRETMTAAAMEFDALDAVAVTIGPGAFTGLRIGLATARGIALAAGIPCLGVTTLETIAGATSESERSGRTILVVLDAKRRDVYAQAFDAAGRPVSEPTAVDPARLVERVPQGDILLAGDAAAIVEPLLTAAGRDVRVSASSIPDCAAIAGIAAARWRPGDRPPAPRPLYLRAPDVTLPGPPPGRATG